MIDETKAAHGSATDRRVLRRQRRADATRRRALSPWRILFMVLTLPVTVAGIALGIYLRTSEYDRTGAMMHLWALAGCEAARSVGLGPMRKGQLGYHERNDPDGNGIACETGATDRFNAPAPVQSVAPRPDRSNSQTQRKIGAAKFVRPQVD